jgi:hypothetical protein
MLEGFSTWPARDVVFLLSVFFAASGFVWITKTQLKNLNKRLDIIEKQLGSVMQYMSSFKDMNVRLARMDGRLDGLTGRVGHIEGRQNKKESK